MQIAIPEWLQVVFDIVLSGVAGSLVTIYFTRSHERTQVTLDVIKEYRALYGELAEVLGLLASPSELGLPENQNRVKALGNWYEVISALWLTQEVNRRLLKRVGIVKSARNFHDVARRASDSQEWLKKSVQAWHDLATLAAKQRGV
jgi:hypothetical protein